MTRSFTDWDYDGPFLSANAAKRQARAIAEDLGWRWQPLSFVNFARYETHQVWSAEAFCEVPGLNHPASGWIVEFREGKGVCYYESRFVSFEVELKVKAGTAKESVALALEMLRAAGFEVLDPCR